MSNPTVVGPSKGPVFDVMGDRVTVKTHGLETNKRFSLTEFTSPQNGGPPPRRHAWSEGYWVLNGEIEIGIGETSRMLSTGSWVVVPGGTTHWLKTLTVLQGVTH